jgi:hypothetical protein
LQVHIEGVALSRLESGCKSTAGKGSNQNEHRHQNTDHSTNVHKRERTIACLYPVSAASGCVADVCDASQPDTRELLSGARWADVLVCPDQSVRAVDMKIVSRLATMPPISSQKANGANHTLGTRFGGRLATLSGPSAGV